MRIIGTFRDPDGILSDATIERDVYPDDAVEQLKALNPEGCTFLHMKVHR
ncbi:MULTISPECIES: hypothetical protein [Bacillati]|uniref:Uncharacterized protein n=1 Tax=Arthrobacter russicus TaxID=172040 RepID=A0ABU1JEN0_9MICC|nr:hypothetical protein [Arthrobacter russicus]MDR6268935.1 hypothetical protein [Arthrobacter russicus]MDR6270580.1 hypothetical protein [Arthrobacter russicus]